MSELTLAAFNAGRDYRALTQKQEAAKLTLGSKWLGSAKLARKVVAPPVPAFLREGASHEN